MRTMLALVLALVACKDAAPASTPPAPLPVATTTTGVPGSQNLAPLAGVMTQLRTEASSRAPVKIPAEAVFDAIAARGVTVSSTKQVLAAIAQAQYCALATVPPAIGVAVCEYPTAEAAEAGKRALDTRYAKLVPDAVRSVRGTTLLTIANASAHRDVRDRVLETFESL